MRRMSPVACKSPKASGSVVAVTGDDGRQVGTLVVVAPAIPLDAKVLRALATALEAVIEHSGIVPQPRPRGSGSGPQAPVPAQETHAAFLDKLIEYFPGVMAVLGPPPDFRVELVNKGFLQLLPEAFRDSASVVGLASRELARGDPEQSRVMSSLITSVYETGEPVSVELYEASDPLRGITYWNWMAVPIGNSDDAHGRSILLVAHDITEAVATRKRIQEAARQARSRADELEAVINQMADGVIIFSREGQILRINPAAERMVGPGIMPHVPTGAPGEPLSLFTTQGERIEPGDLPTARAIRGELVIGMQMLLKKANNEQIVISVSASPLFGNPDSPEEATGAVVVFHDITQEKIVERLKDEFLSIVSHELRTPLTAIMGYSDLMLRGVHGGLTDRQGKAIRAVRANALRLLHLINDLLDVSKLEAGSVTLNAEPVSLGELTSRTITRTRVIAAEAGVSIINAIPQKHLPRVVADDPKLQQVIENLLANAVKFTPSGGTVTFDADVSPIAADDPLIQNSAEFEDMVPRPALKSVVVTCTDTGAGIEPDQLARIWDRFYQVDSTAKRRSGGAGLGLAIVRNLIELHGGRVWVSSPGPGKGSRFSFSLPAATPTEFEGEPPALEDEGGLLAGRRASVDHALDTVLVVEDHPDQREIICDMLEADGYSVTLAQDGEEAIEMATRTRPRAIILDVLLPRADGWEVLDRLKSDPSSKDIPVLIISVVDQPGFGKKLGAQEYLLKPLDPYELRSALRRMMEAQGASAAAENTKSG